MESLLLGIVFWIIGLWILYHVIKSAIDNSQTAQNIKILTNLLTEQYSDMTNDYKKDYQELNIPVDRCPACGAKILETDEVCSSCGLTIANL